jgi:hypothetical protein
MNTEQIFDGRIQLRVNAIEILAIVSEGLILALWRQGLDTRAIAKHMKLREHQIYNRLFHLREASRNHGGKKR